MYVADWKETLRTWRSIFQDAEEEDSSWKIPSRSPLPISSKVLPSFCGNSSIIILNFELINYLLATQFDSKINWARAVIRVENNYVLKFAHWWTACLSDRVKLIVFINSKIFKLVRTFGYTIFPPKPNS